MLTADELAALAHLDGFMQAFRRLPICHESEIEGQVRAGRRPPAVPAQRDVLVVSPLVVAPNECRTCHAKVTWLVNEKTGRAAPIDNEPSPDGNVEVDLLARTPGGVGVGVYRVLGPRTVAEKRAAGVPLFKSHFATCPQATQHRRS